MKLWHRHQLTFSKHNGWHLSCLLSGVKRCSNLSRKLWLQRYYKACYPSNIYIYVFTICHRDKLAEYNYSEELQYQLWSPFFLNYAGQIRSTDFLCLKSQSTSVRPRYTYPSNHFKVLLLAEINGFAVEKPLENGAQGWITRHLAWQHEALSHGGVQTQGRNNNLGGFYSIRKIRRLIRWHCVSMKSS